MSLLEDDLYPYLIKTIKAYSHTNYTITIVANKFMRLRNSSTPIPYNIIPIKGEQIVNSTLSPDNKYIATTNVSNKVTLWNTISRKKQKVLYGPATKFIHYTTFSPDSKKLFACCTNHNIIIWNIPSFKLYTTLIGHFFVVVSLSVSPNNKILVSGSHDYSVIIWNLQNKKQIKKIKFEYCVRDVQYTPNGKHIVVITYSKIIIYETVKYTEIRVLEIDYTIAYTLRISRDSKTISYYSLKNICQIPV